MQRGKENRQRIERKENEVRKEAIISKLQAELVERKRSRRF